MPKALDLSGQRFGRLTVIERAPNAVHGGQIKARWDCRCDCGTDATVSAGDLRDGNTKSCGCFKIETAGLQRLSHGHTRMRKPTAEYATWLKMHSRCSNPSNNRYYVYGARGIRVCERWQDFATFLADMGPRPSNKHSIDRIDNNGNYEPTNCRWATALEQHANTSTNHVITFDGRTMHMEAWARELGIPSRTLHNRLNQSKWPIERAFTTPVKR